MLRYETINYKSDYVGPWYFSYLLYPFNHLYGNLGLPVPNYGMNALGTELIEQLHIIL